MKPSRTPLALAALLVVSLAACGGDDDSPALSGEPATPETTASAEEEVEDPTTTAEAEAETDDDPEAGAGARPFPTAAPFPAPGEEPADGEHAADILAIDVEAGTITVDLIEFLTGEEARIAHEEETGDPDGPPNDYFIRDADEEPRTFDVPADAEISIVDYSGEVQNVPATLEELVAAHEETPFTVWITLTDGDLTAVHQQFTP